MSSQHSLPHSGATHTIKRGARSPSTPAVPRLARPRGRPKAPQSLAGAAETPPQPTAPLPTADAPATLSVVVAPTATSLLTVGGKRVLRKQDVQEHYANLTPHALEDIPVSELPRIQLNRKNTSYHVEDLERFIARHRNTGAVRTLAAV